jgi:hypothetical protein
VTGSDIQAAIDFEQALLDPGSTFDTPEAVLASEVLSNEQKIEILRRWEYDASENGVATEEGMPEAENDLLHRILVAIGQLTDNIDVEQVGPTKQHGIPRSAVKKGS